MFVLWAIPWAPIRPPVKAGDATSEAVPLLIVSLVVMPLVEPQSALWKLYTAAEIDPAREARPTALNCHPDGSVVNELLHVALCIPRLRTSDRVPWSGFAASGPGKLHIRLEQPETVSPRWLRKGWQLYLDLELAQLAWSSQPRHRAEAADSTNRARKSTLRDRHPRERLNLNFADTNRSIRRYRWRKCQGTCKSPSGRTADLPLRGHQISQWADSNRPIDQVVSLATQPR